MPYSAREMLAGLHESGVAWAVFDAEWYASTYETARGGSAAETLQFYLEEGQLLGHAPNRFFDEAWYRRRYPQVAREIQGGLWESGFDHYCREGFRTLSPHWLYDESLYRRLYADLSDAALEAIGFINRFDHYLKHGNHEGRLAHPLFDPAYYLARLSENETRAASEIGPFIHFLGRPSDAPEVATSLYFDPAWYRARYPEVRDAIAQGRYGSGLHHYLCNESPGAFDPLPQFSESWYRGQHSDVAAAIEVGQWRNGYEHFLSHGAAEFRSPHETIDLEFYRSEYPAVRTDLADGLARDAFAHFLASGLKQGWHAGSPPDDATVTEAQATALLRIRARALLPLRGRDPLRFDLGGPAELSAVMLLRNDFPLTMLALTSLRAQVAEPIELILVDGGGAGEIRDILRYVTGAKLLRFEVDIGRAPGFNAALYSVSGEQVLFLGSGIELLPGALARARSRLAADPSIGAVGGKILRPHGAIEQAGGIVWRDGSATSYLRDGPPLAPESNFVRDVDWCSADFLLARNAPLQEGEGFDAALDSNEHADSDLCLRLQAAGYRVVYDPACVAQRLASDTAPETISPESRERFSRKHFGTLLTRYVRAQPEPIAARHARAHYRVLFVDDAVPLRRLGQGFVRSNDIIRVLSELGCDVTVFPMRADAADPAAQHADLPEAAEVMHAREAGGLGGFLAERSGHYDAIWIARTHNLEPLRPALAPVKDAVRLVLDTEAVISLREAGRAALAGTEFDLHAALRTEFAAAPLADVIVAVNEPEAGVLRSHGLRNIVVLGHAREPHPTPRGWDERAGMLFLGALPDAAAPNYDALAWFADSVLPLVEQELGWETRLTVAGPVARDADLSRWADHPRITLRGPVTDVATLYDAHRVFVAPTRFAAGLPYKVHEAASYGLPVVATELLREQLGWTDGVDLLAADPRDPARFAAQILSLYRDQALWSRIRESALARVQAENRPDRYRRVVARIAGLPARMMSGSERGRL